MPAVQRQGDANSAGGVAQSGVSSVRVNGRAVVVPSISVTPHPCCGEKGCSKHCSAKTNGGSATVRAGGKPIIRTSVDKDTCGHPRSGGSPNVRVA
jgi:uncharacterized Zn-binding protein involved in type VI secretion